MNNIITIAQKLGTSALKLMAVGLLSTTSNELRKAGNSIGDELGGEVKRGYQYYAKPKLEKLTLVKKNK